jgi:aldehyde dehydrogenase (NAD+)
MLIDGKLVPARDGGFFENFNPATEAVIGEIPDASEADVGEAIGAARRAFDDTDWSTDHGFRQRCLQQLQTALESEREELRTDLVSEVGTPVLLTYSVQLDEPLADAIRWPQAAIADFEWERDLGVAEVMGMQSRRVVRREAVGVVAAITPWNFPFEVEINKLAQALAAGNTVVLKPAPDTPAHALRMARLIAEQTDIPAGVVNIVTPEQHTRGEQLLTDPRVDMVSFTGSTAVGQRIMELGAPTFKRVFLELGGKGAHIVLEDADFEAVLPATSFMCAHAGQGCGMLTRLLLPRSRYEEGVQIVAESFAGVTVGDPTDPSVLTGPVINQRQHERVLSYIEKGKQEGARVVFGGNGRPAGMDKGWFVEPTLFADVDNNMAIAQDEIFGPVVVIIPFDDDEDAVRIANDSRYGLSGGVSSASDERALTLARRIRAGVIGVNGGMFYGPDVPFGGFKSSGIGRQNGIYGLEQYTEIKALGLPTSIQTEKETGR